MQDSIVAGKNNTYPEPVSFNEHYSIFLTAFRHQVNWSSLGDQTRRNAYVKLLLERKWRIHDYLIEENQAGDSKGGRGDIKRFQPNYIMTPQAHEVLFGETLFTGDSSRSEDTSGFIAKRLNPDVGTVGQSESLMFSLASSDWLNAPLTISNSPTSNKPFEYDIQINWVDLFLYNDGTGMLAIRVQSVSDTNGIDELGRMTRTLRDFKNSVNVRKKEGDATSVSFWDKLVLRDWLGLDQPNPDPSFISNLSGEAGKDIGGLLFVSDACAAKVFDGFEKYCKTMIIARMPDISDEMTMKWGRPLSDPPIYFSEKQYHALHRGEWDVTLAASQKAIVAGYATVRDLVLFELATVSDEQASTGWNGERGWQYSLEYIRKAVENNFIEIWEYWAGLALRDTCVFVAYDESMPITWQAESYYYPLYMLAYHNRFRLDCLSQDIIDYDMADALHGRQVRDAFQRFRNQYWFQDVTIDFQGVEVYEQMQHGMGLNEQYETVAAEIADVSDHLQEKWDRGTRTLMTVLAILFAPLMEVWNSWIIPKVKEAPTEVLAQMAGVMLVLLLMLVLGWMKFRAPIMVLFRRMNRRFRRFIGAVGN